jgi:hypothetical protein
VHLETNTLKHCGANGDGVGVGGDVGDVDNDVGVGGDVGVDD